MYLANAWCAAVCPTNRTGGTSGDKGRRGTCISRQRSGCLILEGTCNVYVATGRTLDGRAYVSGTRLRVVSSSSLTADTNILLSWSVFSCVEHSLVCWFEGSSEGGCRLVGHLCPTCDSIVGWQDMSVSSCERTVMRCDGIGRLGRVGLVVVTVDRALFFIKFGRLSHGKLLCTSSRSSTTPRAEPSTMCFWRTDTLAARMCEVALH